MNTFSKQPRTCRIVYIQFKFWTLLFENTGNFNQRVLLELHIPPARFQLTYGTLQGTACRHVSSLVLSFPGFQGSRESKVLPFRGVIRVVVSAYLLMQCVQEVKESKRSAPPQRKVLTIIKLVTVLSINLK